MHKLLLVCVQQNFENIQNLNVQHNIINLNEHEQQEAPTEEELKKLEKVDISLKNFNIKVKHLLLWSGLLFLCIYLQHKKCIDFFRAFDLLTNKIKFIAKYSFCLIFSTAFSAIPFSISNISSATRAISFLT